MRALVRLVWLLKRELRSEQGEARLLKCVVEHSIADGVADEKGLGQVQA